jgi:hypothetical protein
VNWQNRKAFYEAKFVLVFMKKLVNFGAVIASQSPGTSRPRPYASIFKKLLDRKTFIDLVLL